jgi:hypothetical protein
MRAVDVKFHPVNLHMTWKLAVRLTLRPFYSQDPDFLSFDHDLLLQIRGLFCPF